MVVKKRKITPQEKASQPTVSRQTLGQDQTPENFSQGRIGIGEEVAGRTQEERANENFEMEERRSGGRTQERKIEDVEPKREAGGISEGIVGFGKKLESTPIIGGAFQGAEKIAGKGLELLDKTFELFGGDLFSDEQIRINKDTFGIKDGLDFIKDPKVLEFIGAATLGVGTSLVLTRTAVGVSAKVGLNKIPLAVRSVASRFAANGKSVASTKGLLGKLGMSNITASHALAILGTYPFAGFIKEEALQTAGMGFESAYWNGDKEGMEDAIAIQDEMLDPSMWSRVVAKVPFANVLGSLNDYWKAASKKNEIHKKVLQSLKGG